MCDFQMVNAVFLVNAVATVLS